MMSQPLSSSLFFCEPTLSFPYSRCGASTLISSAQAATQVTVQKEHSGRETKREQTEREREGEGEDSSYTRIQRRRGRKRESRL